MSKRARRSDRAAAERRARRRSFLAVVAVGVGVLTVAAVAVVILGGGRNLDKEAAAVENYPYPVQMFPPDPGGRAHFAVSETYDDYSSNPPTSGPHTAAVAPGVYDDPVPKESAVHNMEHSQVVVWYNCGAGVQPLDEPACGGLRQELATIVTEANDGGKRVLMTPYPDMDNRIALTAWQFLDAFDEFDPQRVRTFIDTFYCHTNLEGYC
jgi:uncharacterized protein DUF3105